MPEFDIGSVRYTPMLLVDQGIENPGTAEKDNHRWEGVTMRMGKYCAILIYLAGLSPLAVCVAAEAPRADSDTGACVTITRHFWIDVFQKRNAAAATQYMSKAYIQHSPPPHPDIAHWMELWKGVFANPPYGPGADFPEAAKDYRTEIVSIIGDERFAFLRAHDTGHWLRGVNKGKAFDFRYYDIFRCEAGLIVEHWHSED